MSESDNGHVSNILYDDWLEERMADPEFRAEWEASKPAYQAERLRIMQELENSKDENESKDEVVEDSSTDAS